MGQIVYRDKVTGAEKEFDHEPTEQELHAAFGATPSQPGPGAAPPGAQPPQPDGPSGLSHFLTKWGAPALGTVIGGAVGGPLGMGIGAAGGKGFGDAAAALMGDQAEIQKDPVEEILDLAGTGAGTAAFGAVAPQLQKLPGPLKWSNVGIGAAGGYGAGQAIGHPGLGTAIGAGMGGYNLLSSLLRGVGAATEAIGTPRFGSLAPGASEGPVGPGGAPGGVKLPGTVVPPEPNLPDLNTRMQAKGFPASGPPTAASPLTASMPSAKGGAPIAPGKPGVRPRLSKEVPYKAPDALGGLIREVPGNTNRYSQLGDQPSPDVMERVPVAPGPGITSPTPPMGTLPGISNTPSLRWNADVETPSGVTMSRSPQEAIKGLKSIAPTAPNEEFGGSTIPEPPSMVDSRGGPGGSVPRQSPFTPQTVDSAEGLSLAEQDAWSKAKAQNGWTDDMLNSWFTSQQGGKTGIEGMSLQNMIDALMKIAPKR